MPTPSSTIETAQPPGQYIVDCAAISLSPPDTRQPPDWAEEYIQIPNSARGMKRFYRLTNPAMNEPLCRSVDPKVKRLVVMAPTGAGKTTLFNVRVPFGIANSLGSMLIGMQSDPDADDYCEKNLNPILDSCAPVLALKPTGAGARHLIKLNSRTYPECTLDVGGPGKSNRQRKSVQWVGLDEAWLILYGAILEFEARLHDRWNGQICIVSQGAEQKVPDQKIELDEYWQTTDQAELHFECPQCGHVQQYWWDSGEQRFCLKYDVVKAPDGSTDYAATGDTARIVCENADCLAVLPDTYETRRRLAESLDRRPEQYQSTAKPEKPEYCGRHFNVLAMYWVPWSKVVIEWVKANEAASDGDMVPLMTFITKRLARTYWLPKQEVSVTLTAAAYSLTQYADGTMIDGEVYRFMAIDVQKDHFWVLVRAFRADGSSRLIYADKVKTIGEARQRQQDLNVPDRLVFVDCNYFPTLVYDLSAKYDWTAVEGDKAPGYVINIAPPRQRPQYVTRYYNNPDTIQASGGIARRILFSRVRVTDELERLLKGIGPTWEHGEGTTPEWHKHLVSEIKVETKGEGGKPTFKYVKIKQRRNDLRWCEVACTLGAIMMDVLRPPASEPVPAESVDTPDQESA